MIGAIIGDIVGSVYEFHNIHSKNFEFFSEKGFATDDSIMTLALAKAILECHGDTTDLEEKAIRYMREIGRPYPNCGYGGHFYNWIYSDSMGPYNSCGNGSAMRVSAAGFAARSIEEAKELSAKVTRVTHDHPDGMKGAEATAVMVRMALEGKSKSEMKEAFTANYYPINFTIDGIRPTYEWGALCSNTVPQAMEAFFESTGYEDAIRNAISIGGDSDTIGAITGAVAEAFYGVPDELVKKALNYLDFRLSSILYAFEEVFPPMNRPKSKTLADAEWNEEKWLNEFNENSKLQYQFHGEDTRQRLHELRMDVYTDTRLRVNKGRYTIDNQEVIFPDPAPMIENTFFYTEELPESDGPRYETEIRVEPKDCLTAARDLIEAGYRPALLNMASRGNPGGGVMRGCGAQEENIFRRSDIHLSLYQFARYAGDYGLIPSELQYPMDRNFGGIYTPDIFVFRGEEKDGYPLLRYPYTVSVISVAALNHPKLTDDGKLGPSERLGTINKIRTIFRIALLHNHDTLVLSALGCGAFKNPPAEVARLFHEVLEEPEFKGRFRLITFAIRNDHNSKGNYEYFKKEFAE